MQVVPGEKERRKEEKERERREMSAVGGVGCFGGSGGVSFGVVGEMECFFGLGEVVCYWAWEGGMGTASGVAGLIRNNGVNGNKWECEWVRERMQKCVWEWVGSVCRNGWLKQRLKRGEGVAN